MDIIPEVLNRFVSRPVAGEKRPVFVNVIDGQEHDSLGECHAAIATHIRLIGGLYNNAARRDYTLVEIQNLLNQ